MSYSKDDGIDYNANVSQIIRKVTYLNSPKKL